MRLLKKIVCRPYHTYSIEYFDTETRQYNHEIWTISQAIPTSETDFCEYLREHYTIFSDSQDEMLPGGTRLSPQFDTWCSARATHTRNWYGWDTFQQAVDQYPERGTPSPPRITRPGRIHFNTARNDWAALYGNRPSIGIIDEVTFHGTGYGSPTKHHHFCDKCHKTRKCGACEGKPKVRKLCDSCELVETMRVLRNTTMEMPNIPPQQYRVTVHNTGYQASWDSETTTDLYNGHEFVHGASNNSGNNTPQT
jgi:hypothetical protein